MGQTPSPASPSPTTTTDLLEEELVDLPGFAPAPPQSPPGGPEATETPTWSTPSPSDDEAAAEGESPRPVSAATTGGASSRASTDWRDLVPIAATTVGLASMLVRWLRTRRRPLPDGVWIADEQDAEAIAAPLARIAARHSPVGGKESADMVDGLEILVGTTGYALKNLEAEAQATSVVLVEPEPAA